MAQILLLELVGRGPDKPDNVVVVGDDDQSIYRFRGASYAAFRQFEDRFGEPPAWAPERAPTPVTALPLLENRRSSANILSAANTLIEHNPVRLKAGQPLRPTKEPGAPVEIVFARDEADEADVIVERLRSAFEALPARLPNPDGTDRPKRWSDLAVLYRRHRHRDAIVERLRRADIPFTVVGGVGLFAQPEIRDLEAALRVSREPRRLGGLHPAPDRRALAVRRARDPAPRPRRGLGPPAGVRGRSGDRHRSRAAAVRRWTTDASTPVEPARQRTATRRGPPGQAGPALRRSSSDLVPRGTRDGPFTILEEYLVRTRLLRTCSPSRRRGAADPPLGRPAHALRRRLAGASTRRQACSTSSPTSTSSRRPAATSTPTARAASRPTASSS